MRGSTTRRTIAAVLMLALAIGGCRKRLDPFEGDPVWQAHQRKVLAELGTLDRSHPFAGRYYSGDGLGVNLSLDVAPLAGFTFLWSGCLGTYDLNHGAVQGDARELHLTCARPNVREGFQGTATDFLVVRWGERRYLIEEADVVRFCNAVNYGREPRDVAHGLFLLRDGDEDLPVDGLPELPERFQPMLLKAPIVCAVTAVGDSTILPSDDKWKKRQTTVTLNAGRDRGVFKGMELRTAQTFDNFVVAEVRDRNSTAVLSQTSQKGFTNDPLSQVGWELTTGSPWR